MQLVNHQELILRVFKALHHSSSPYLLVYVEISILLLLPGLHPHPVCLLSIPSLHPALHHQVSQCQYLPAAPPSQIPNLTTPLPSANHTLRALSRMMSQRLFQIPMTKTTCILLLPVVEHTLPISPAAALSLLLPQTVQLLTPTSSHPRGATLLLTHSISPHAMARSSHPHPAAMAPLAPWADPPSPAASIHQTMVTTPETPSTSPT